MILARGRSGRRTGAYLFPSTEESYSARSFSFVRGAMVKERSGNVQVVTNTDNGSQERSIFLSFLPVLALERFLGRTSFHD